MYSILSTSSDASKVCKIVLQAVVMARRPSFERSPFRFAFINFDSSKRTARASLSRIPLNPCKLIAAIIQNPFNFDSKFAD